MAQDPDWIQVRREKERQTLTRCISLTLMATGARLTTYEELCL